MIVVRNISKKYGGATAVAEVSFEVAAGECLVLLGTSGCGKTTTLRMINRLIEPDAGTVEVGGRNVRDQSPEILRRGIGYVLQRNSLFPHLSVAENMAVVPRLLGWEAARIDARSRELMAKLQLPEAKLRMYPAALSGGEAQRVNLARALAADPPVLLMDEPFSALDTITRAAIRAQFQALDEFRRKATVLVTHDVEEAFDLGDRICLMDGGRIVQCGAPAELLFRPATEFVRRFLAAAYLPLALRITPVSAVWELLADEAGGQPIAGPPLPATASFSEALATLEGAGRSSRLCIADERSGANKLTSWQGLLEAFGHYKPPMG